MKLNKEDLKNALAEASLNCPKDIFNDALVSFFEGTLEIEGYVRADHLRDSTKMVDEWTRFDPNDESTFPPKGAKYLIVTESGQFIVSLFIDDKVIKSFWADCVTHWKALPQPPVETEVKK